MRRFIVVMLALLSTGCFTMTLPGPGGIHTVVPVGGTIVVRVYNYCSPKLRAEGNDHLIEIPYGESREIVLPSVFSEGNQQKTVIFTALTRSNAFMGVREEYFNPDYNVYVTRKQFIIGGQYRHIYDNQGRDACRQDG